ncbi:hypothetical protein [Rhodococcus sp. HNM0569]|uniref:hypothetical protein n=1 Tax=Rhodococcus sp. HNM0569 TaxID=2716340 RepID=UPI00146AA8EE|nr:hypothetical protein [Rhodococcus sp. HNM0569]NLU81387.1 hypothetical protein [Rhodococcus sp. HNM0569]
MVGEPDTAVELAMAGEALFDAGHADEDQPVLAAVLFVAEHLEGTGGQAFGCVDDAELDTVAAGRGVGLLADADAGTGGDPGEVFTDASDGGPVYGV